MRHLDEIQERIDARQGFTSQFFRMLSRLKSADAQFGVNLVFALNKLITHGITARSDK